MSEEEREKKQATAPVFVSPIRFYYSNAIRTYTSGPEVFIEFARMLPPGADEQPTAKGECGVVVSVPVATRLIAQIQDSIQAALKRLNESNQNLAAQLIKAQANDNEKPAS
ncbi:hypothetical protein [Acidithiobacillus thiooxidans]|uniref:Uncharacterized protein n=1 Tax=Acidithiobacillus thiooxidans ATCC 19377 TaxID=637390 RepID=A0A543PZI2_ACITH|nr:hypothetical protein [Acidithiobacillus thiooxidans]MDX5936459.1 hypothetical protein [Acidithiobacillus thiooxidans]TQN49440.1 hypothetical protein DLNHIDIE_03294 [Acidithiobacillus thiooxidans ATCC 19377]